MTIPEKLLEDSRRLSELLGLEVEVNENGAQICVVTKQANLPGGIYSRARSDVLLLTDVQYPLSAMDMFWMEPDVTLANGTIPAHMTAVESYCGRSWRRWSRHRNGKWVVGVDDLLSQWELVQSCWETETKG